MKKARVLFSILFVVLTLSFISSEAIAADLNLTMPRTSILSRIDFDNAYQMVWSGNVLYTGVVIGEYNTVLIKTTSTGNHGAIFQFDLVFPGGGPIGEFLSIRANQISTGSGSATGMVFAASPGLKSLVGWTFNMNGDDVTLSSP